MTQEPGNTTPDKPVHPWSVTPQGLASGSIVAVPIAAVLIFVLYYVGFLRFDMAPPTDFQAFWVAARFAIEGRAADSYDVFVHRAAQWALHGSTGVPTVSFAYPPQFFFMIIPFGAVEYRFSHWIWLIGGLVLYIWSLRLILPQLSSALVFLVFPPAIWNALARQNGFLTAALVAIAVHGLGRRSTLPGVAFGLLAFKPHLGPVIPLALAIGGRWRVICVSAIVVIGSSVASAFAFGAESWSSFLKMTEVARSWLDASADFYRMMTSVFAAARLLGTSAFVAYGMQIAVATAAIGALLYVIRRKPGCSAEGALIAAAIPLCTPYLLRYDMVILAVPLAWLWAEGSRAGFLGSERMILCGCFLGTSFTSMRIEGAELLTAPIVALVVFVSVVRRCMARIRAADVVAMPHA